MIDEPTAQEVRAALTVLDWLYDALPPGPDRADVENTVWLLGLRYAKLSGLEIKL